MSPDFEDFVISHDLIAAPDELTPIAAAGVEGLVLFGRFVASDDAQGLRRLARRGALVARLVPEAPVPATDSELASPGFTHSAVMRRALERLSEKLAEHDAGGYVRPIDVACDVVDLAEACTALADTLPAT